MKVAKFLTFIVLFFWVSVASFASSLIEGNLKNGLHYRIYEKSNIPIISVNIKIKAGSVFDEKGKYGEAYVVGNSLENCDSPKYKADRLRFIFDKYGVESSVSVSKGFITITATATLENITPLFCLMHEILHSKFDEKGIDYVKRNTINSIKALRNNKDYLSIHAAFTSLIKNGSYAHTSLGTLTGVRSVKRSDILSFYRRYFNAQNMVVSISGGGFTKDDIVQNIEFYFSNIVKGKEAEFPKVEFRRGLHLKDIVRPQTKQSYIYFAFPGYRYGTDGYYASKVLAYILGGSLDSYLMKDIRTKRGYAYSVFSFVYKLPKSSVFVIGLQTQNRFTLDAIREIFKDLRNYKAYITEENLKLVKLHMKGSIPIGLELPQSIAESLSSGYFLNVKGLPWEYELKRIQKVSLNDLKTVASKLFSNTVSIGIVSYKDFSKDIVSIANRYGFK